MKFELEIEYFYVIKARRKTPSVIKTTSCRRIEHRTVDAQRKSLLEETFGKPVIILVISNEIDIEMAPLHFRTDDKWKKK